MLCCATPNVERGYIFLKTTSKIDNYKYMNMYRVCVYDIR